MFVVMTVIDLKKMFLKNKDAWQNKAVIKDKSNFEICEDRSRACMVVS